MKKLDLNIEVEVPVKEGEKTLSPVEIAIKWIQIMLERALNKPETNGRATKMVPLDMHRKYDKVMTALEKHKDGISELEDEDFNFLDKKFKEAEIPVQRGVSEVLIQIEDALDKAKVAKVEKKEKVV